MRPFVEWPEAKRQQFVDEEVLPVLRRRGAIRRLNCCADACALGKCKCGGNLLFNTRTGYWRCIGSAEPICLSLN